MKKIIIAVLLFSFFGAYAWHDPNGPGASNSAMAGTGVAMKNFWAVNNNQAALAFQNNFGLGFYYENKFALQETSYNHLAAVIPALGGSFGLNMSYFGSNNYNEKKLGLAYGHKLGDRFALGVQMDYLHNFIADNYGSKGILTFEIGMITKVTEQISIGAHIFNPLQVKLHDYNNERINAALNVGLSYKPNDNFLINIESEAYSQENYRFKAGGQYSIKDWFFIRAGIANNPNIFSFGAGFNYKSFHIDFSSSMHQVLGFSPQMSFVYQINEE